MGMSPLHPLGQRHTSAWGSPKELKPWFAFKPLHHFSLRVFKQQDTQATSRECWAVVSSQGQGTGQHCCVPACQSPLPAARPWLEPSPPRSVFYFQIPWITAVSVSLKPVFPCHGLLLSLCVSLTPENGN